MKRSINVRSILVLTGSSLLLTFGLVAPHAVAQARSKSGKATTKTVAKKTASTSSGAILFKNKCAKCHGAKGEGGPGYSKPLTGNRSVEELGRFIHSEMPPGPKKCLPADAKQIAEFIFQEFYSPVAQERNRPARVQLSRLTVGQFRNSVADLVGGFHSVLPDKPSGGLHAEYFKGRDMNGNNRVVTRDDAVVKFDFGTEGPVPGKFDPHTFSAVWTGSVFAPDTGDYDFIIKSDHSVRLWMNGRPEPLIDAWVKSGKDTEFRGSIRLLGGRAYPIRLEFSKASQGVDDTEKKKGKPAPPASVELCWQLPRRAVETVPSRYLSPGWMPPTFVVEAPFPPDDRSIGYERGVSVNKAWDDAVTSAALETGNYVASHLRDLTGIPDDAPDRKARVEAYLKPLIQRAFRRKVDPEILDLYVTKQFATAPTVELAVKRTMLFTIKSPRFLYREIAAGPQDPFSVAAQLSFGLWDSLPDDELYLLAQNGEILKPEVMEKQAARMAQSPKAWNKLREFFFRWMKLDEVPEITKNPKRYPEFDATTASDLRSSFDLYLKSVGDSPSSDFRSLFMGKDVFLNGRLAKIYGVAMDPNSDFQPVKLDAKARTGLLTQPYLLSRLAYTDTTSPIHRGVLIIRSMLGRTLNPPPSAFAPLAPSLHPDLTTRERVAMQTKPPMCNACHSRINPLGFTLERFDAIGRIRDAENGKPVVTTGTYVNRKGDTVTFEGASELSSYIANSGESQSAFVEKLFHHLVKQPAAAYGPQILPKLTSDFRSQQFNMRMLMADIVLATAEPSPKTDSTGATR